MTDAPNSAQLERRELPLMEYDPSHSAIIEPADLVEPLPEIQYCVLCYFRDVIAQLKERGLLTEVAKHGSEMGELPLYAIQNGRCQVGLIQAPVGASFAAAILDELIARGIGKFMVCGGCGVLDRQITVGHLLVPYGAVRDEGTSYHYLPSSREVGADPAVIRTTADVLEAHGYPYQLIKTWTTDAFYRETPAKVALRRSEGCLTVEMEAAAYLAVASFRAVQLGMILYAGDDVSGEQWDHRTWQNRSSVRERVFWLALETCLKL